MKAVPIVGVALLLPCCLHLTPTHSVNDLIGNSWIKVCLFSQLADSRKMMHFSFKA